MSIHSQIDALDARPFAPPLAPLRLGLVDDDSLLRDRVLVPRMQQYGFHAHGMGCAAELYVALECRVFDLLVLDVGLPDQDGFAVARRVRTFHPDIGIVMLTGSQSPHDHVRGLSEGADAYLSKPAKIDVLVATLHSVARRLGSRPAAIASPDWHMDSGDWCLITPQGGSVGLTMSERRAMIRLLQAPNAIVTREQLIGALTDDVYNYDPHRLDSLIHRLRRKVQAVSGEVLPLNVVHGEGYVFALSSSR